MTDSSKQYDVSGHTAFTSSDTNVITVQGSASNSRYIVANVGTATVTSTWSGQAATTALTASNERVYVTAIAPFTTWSSANQKTFQGYNSDTQTVAAKLTFSDNTIFPDALGSDITSYLTTEQYLAFASSVPAAISVAADGIATLHQNWHNLVDITTSSTCPDNSIAAALLVSEDEAVAANRNAPLGDLDLGIATGLQYGGGVSAGETFDVAVRINSQTANLLAFQIRIAFDGDVFEATACSQGSGWKAAWGCTLNDPVDRVLVVGSSKASTARGAAVLVATITHRVKAGFTEARLSPIGGDIEAMTRGDAVEEAASIAAGAGNVKVNGPSRRRGLLKLAVPRGWARDPLALSAAAPHHPPLFEGAYRRRRSLLEHEDSLVCTPGACDPGKCGQNEDTNGDCVFNANDLLFLEEVFNRQNDGTADQLPSMTSHQTSQLSPTLRRPGFPDGSDLQYMLYTILQRYRFFVNAARDVSQNAKVPTAGAVVTVGPLANNSIVVQVTFNDQTGHHVAGPQSTLVTLEIGMLLNRGNGYERTAIKVCCRGAPSATPRTACKSPPSTSATAPTASKPAAITKPRGTTRANTPGATARSSASSSW